MLVGLAPSSASPPTSSCPAPAKARPAAAGRAGASASRGRSTKATTRPVKKRTSRPPQHARVTSDRAQLGASDCWVDLTTSPASSIFKGTCAPATSAATWTEKHPVTLELGNPGGASP